MADNAENSNPFGRSWKIAAGFIVVILAIVLIGVLWPSSDNEQQTAPQEHDTVPSSAPEVNESAPSNDSEGECPELSTNTDLPTSAPNASWDRHPVGMIVPTSDEHGPAVQDDTFWGCYSQTPTGALFAGLGMLSNASAGEAEATTDSPQRDEFLDRHAYDGSGSLPTVEGFRVIMATEEEAVIEYEIADPEAEAYIRLNLVWSENAQDWRINLSSNQNAVEVGQINDPSAFISWR